MRMGTRARDHSPSQGCPSVEEAAPEVVLEAGRFLIEQSRLFCIKTV